MSTRTIIAAVIMCLAGVFLLGSLMFLPLSGYPNETVYLEIPQGASLNRIATILEKQNLVPSKAVFKWGAIVLGKRRSIKSGDYEINGRVSIYALIRCLSQGITVLHKVTIPEGLRMTEIFKRLTDTGFGAFEDYMRYSTDAELIRSLGIDPEIVSLEGFLFPETYFFSRNTPTKRVIQTMVNTFFENVPDDYGNRARSVGLTYYEAIILASIIEKETGAASERRLIASVFHNRLRRNMRLQTDPTVIYGIKNFNGNLTRRQLRTRTPYNTYMVKGLPPTPIASPGLNALLAAVNPAKTDYLFFVAKGDGTHLFTSNYRDHENAVTKYQLQRRQDYRSF